MSWRKFLTKEEAHLLGMAERSRKDARAIVEMDSAQIMRIRNTCVQRSRRKLDKD